MVLGPHLLPVLVLAALGLLGPPQAQAAPRYVDAPPLAQIVKTPVGEVAPGPTQVPLITWGGDIATVLANGNARRTGNGSIFQRRGLDLNLVREDKFAEQVAAFVSGRSPYLRGTLGMVNMAAELLVRDPRTRPVVIYQLTWSAGGDALVVKSGIHGAKDLKGKTIAVQAYGPHVDYLTKILADASLSPKDVTIRWLPDLTGTDNTPMAALHEADIDAALVIIPDALALTSNGTVGTGAEDSVRGARILLSTKTANRIIADVYAVRADYLETHQSQVEAFVHGLLEAQGKLRQVVSAKGSDPATYRQVLGAAADLLLDSPQAISDVEGLYADAEFVGLQGNEDFLANPNFPRRLQRLNEEIQQAFTALGLLTRLVPVEAAGWSYERMKEGLAETGTAPAQRFQSEEVASVVARRQQQGTLGEGELFSFEIYFKPNQNDFVADLYKESFNRVIDLASTYGGAIITVEGHSDPMGYLRKKKEGESELILGRVKQSAKNLSLSRAVAVRESVIAYARSAGINLDPSQFAVVGHGIADPKSGICGSEPCAPKSEQEWRDNMRVEFRILQVEAEASVFKPL